MLNALIDVCNKHRPPDASWSEVRRVSNTDAAVARIQYNDGTEGGALNTYELVQLAEVLIQSATVRAMQEIWQ